MVEQWRVIPGYGGDYEVSDQGRVRSRKIAGSRSKIGKWKIRKQAKDHRGYMRLVLSIKGKKNKSYRVHHLVLEAFVGPRPKGYEANHCDGIKHHNEATNLEWATPSENVVHAHRLGLTNHAIGERHGRSKVTDKKVIKIRRLHAEGMQLNKLGKTFGVHSTTVSDIVNFKTWQHVKQKG